MEALLRVEHLKKQFHRNSDGTYVLKDISFEMMPGECLGLMATVWFPPCVFTKFARPCVA